MTNIEQIKQEIEQIKQRNQRVEADKAWETSLTRKVSIAILTYIVVVIFFYVIKIDKPFINAIVPTIGFVLSTQSLPFIKRIWRHYVYTCERQEA